MFCRTRTAPGWVGPGSWNRTLSWWCPINLDQVHQNQSQTTPEPERNGSSWTTCWWWELVLFGLGPVYPVNYERSWFLSAARARAFLQWLEPDSDSSEPGSGPHKVRLYSSTHARALTGCALPSYLTKDFSLHLFIHAHGRGRAQRHAVVLRSQPCAVRSGPVRFSAHVGRNRDRTRSKMRKRARKKEEEEEEEDPNRTRKGSTEPSWKKDRGESSSGLFRSGSL